MRSVSAIRVPPGPGQPTTSIVRAGFLDESDGPPFDRVSRGHSLELIGAGCSRWCFEYPGQPKLCIKVGHNRRGRLQTPRERRYLRRTLAWHSRESTLHLTRFHHAVSTTVGTEWVVDRVFDAENSQESAATQPSKTLSMAFGTDQLEAEPERWHRAFDEFVAWASTTAIVVRDLTPVNLCVQRLRDGEYRLVLIDGIGPRGTLPRWIPTRRYAQQRNRREIVARRLDCLNHLAMLCDTVGDNSARRFTLGASPAYLSR